MKMKPTLRIQLRPLSLRRGGRKKLCGMALVGLSTVSVGAKALEVPETFITPEFLASHTLLDIRAQYAYAKGYTGKGILIAVVDDGLDIAHPEFAGRVSPYMASFIEGVDPTYVGRYPGQIGFAHGTHVTGIAAAARDGVGMHGVAYNAEILPLRILGGRSLDDTESNAFDHAIAHGAKVLNGSYATRPFPFEFLENPVTGEPVPNPHYKELDFQPLLGNVFQVYGLLKRAADADIVLVFGSGNAYQEQGKSSVNPVGNAMFPAINPKNTSEGWYRLVLNSYSDDMDLTNPNTWVLSELDDPVGLKVDFSDLQGALIAVVAVDRKGEISSYSNRCGKAQLWCIAAPGGDYPTPGYTADEGQIYSTVPDSTYGYKVGTSMAAPVVSGAAAVLREAFPYMTARQIIELILTSANSTDLDWGNKDIYGWGMLDLGRAIDGPVQFGAESFAQTFDVNTQGFNSIWSNDISGTGGLKKSGQGHLVMTGHNSYAGATHIQAGKLTVNGALVNSTVTIDADAALGGTGSVAHLIAAGTIQPGNSIGTLSVTGDYTQLSGSRLDIEIDAQGQSDRLVVQGTADIQGGELRVLGLNPDALGRDFTFLQAGQISPGSQFDNADILGTPFIDLALHPVTSATGSGLSLAVRRNDVTFTSLAANRNQAAVAQAVEAQNNFSPEYRAVVMADTTQTAQQYYGQLSGEVHASSLSALMDTSGVLRQASLGRLATTGALAADAGNEHDATNGVWGRALGSWGSLAASHDTARMTRSLSGVMFGADTRLGEQTRAGIGAALSRSSYGTDALGSAKADGYHLMAYASQSVGALALRGGASYSWYRLHSKRHIAMPGAEQQKASYNVGSAQIFAEAAYQQQWNQWALEPYVNVAQVWMRRGSFSETGGLGALQGSSQQHNTTFSTLGARSQFSLAQTKHGDIAATVNMGWRHLFGNKTPRSEMRFSTGPSFSIHGAPLARDAFISELGLELLNSRDHRFSLVYTGQFAGGTRDQGVQARASWAF
ncbi:autotransporter domain-containing protein [Alcaligenes endophyticus]|uniref:Autotransporter domain-containing protein n=1 Tax=Alcaligenes endophyticus TaxID=1929088 RepID=A0ABT8EJ42_9BURK|nr:autotransporter serine protease [Alcaligenes endophyticus]MCX5591629.1 autotransporter domain-containing protein [Alcaligenes endophyticus]MDN4121306.1 autotransporter domain-containing protein [Alcaligenes endophyticus]